MHSSKMWLYTCSNHSIFITVTLQNQIHFFAVIEQKIDAIIQTSVFCVGG